MIVFTSGDRTLLPANLTHCNPDCPSQVYRFDRDTDGNGIFDEPSRRPQLALVSAVDAGVVPLGLPEAGNAPSWSPAVNADGSQIAFVTDATNLLPSKRAGGGGEHDGDLLVAEFVLGSIRRVLDGADTTGVPGAHGNPALSKTGQVIAFDTMAAAAIPGAAVAGGNGGRAVVTVRGHAAALAGGARFRHGAARVREHRAVRDRAQRRPGGVRTVGGRHLLAELQDHRRHLLPRHHRRRRRQVLDQPHVQPDRAAGVRGDAVRARRRGGRRVRLDDDPRCGRRAGAAGRSRRRRLREWRSRRARRPRRGRHREHRLRADHGRWSLDRRRKPRRLPHHHRGVHAPGAQSGCELRGRDRVQADGLRLPQRAADRDRRRRRRRPALYHRRARRVRRLRARSPHRRADGPARRAVLGRRLRFPGQLRRLARFRRRRQPVRHHPDDHRTGPSSSA